MSAGFQRRGGQIAPLPQAAQALQDLVGQGLRRQRARSSEPAGTGPEKLVSEVMLTPLWAGSVKSTGLQITSMDPRDVGHWDILSL